MKLAKSTLQFQNYTVNQLSFLSIPDFHVQEGETFELNPQFSRVIKRVEDDEYNLTLGIKLGESGQRLPFLIDISITGYFKINQISEPEKAMKLNATSILFPYLRALLTMLTSIASIPPVILPPINFSEMLKEENTCQEALKLTDSEDREKQ